MLILPFHMETYPSLVSILNMTFDNSSVNYSRFCKLYGTVCFHCVLAKPDNLRLRRADKPLRRADKPLRRADKPLRRAVNLFGGQISLFGDQINLFGDQINLFGDQINLFGDQIILFGDQLDVAGAQINPFRVNKISLRRKTGINNHQNLLQVKI